MFLYKTIVIKNRQKVAFQVLFYIRNGVERITVKNACDLVQQADHSKLWGFWSCDIFQLYVTKQSLV